MPQPHLKLRSEEILERLKMKSPKHYQRLVRLFNERDEIIKSTPSKFYVPNGKAEEFIKMVGENKNFLNMFIAANAVGKSAAGANIITNICYGVQSKYFDYPLFQKFPYLKKGRIISDPTTIKEKIIPELKKWFPENEGGKLPEANYETAKEGKNYEAKFVTNTGWEIDIMSNEQDPKEFESVDLGFVWIDEPMPKDRFLATVARGRIGMIIIWTFTPLSYSAWIKDDIVNKADEVGMNYVEADVEDNCEVHGIRGILKHENIQRMIAMYPEDEKQARAFGKFGHLIGRVHKKFSRKIHVIQPFAINEKDYTCYMALDVHPRVPDHAVWIAVDRKGSRYVVAELVSSGSTALLTERIKAIETSRNMRVTGRLIDPSAYNDDQHREQPSVGSQLFSKGLNFIKGSKDLVGGIKRVDEAFDYEIKGGVFIREPEVFIFNTCRVTVKQLEEYVWDDYKGRTADGKQPKGKPKDRNDHMPENLRRLLVHEPKFVPKPVSYGYNSHDEDEEFDPYK